MLSQNQTKPLFALICKEETEGVDVPELTLLKIAQLYLVPRMFEVPREEDQNLLSFPLKKYLCLVNDLQCGRHGIFLA